ncbi:Mitochodrial transcription termination factor [Parasponia andersonii]|uniref:Mitochodrial transcription termination factor n=1 Tax=Parasponia andersonii TaxID=3476 RepID=A0A2P5CKM4_PARAD|nr:Mitochodrial transcription termination factor [Parasponia andersonii]
MIPQIFKCMVSLSLKSKSQPVKRPQLCFSISALSFSSLQPENPIPKPAVPLAEYLINHHQFSPEAASKASSSFAYVKNPQQSDLVLSYLQETGFTKTHLEKLVKRYPKVLFVNPHIIKPKIKIFQDSGFSASDIADIVSTGPWILKRSVDNRLGPSILVLKSVLGSNDSVAKLLKSSGWFLKHDLEKTMMVNIDFMKSCGISPAQIINYVFIFPRLFLLKPQSIVNSAKRVEELGLDRNSKLFLQAIRVLCSMSLKNWELKRELFRKLGFSETDILAVFKRSPQVFCVSEKKIKQVTSFLITAANIDFSYVVRFPELLIYSIEERLKPRLEIMEILEKKQVLNKKPSLVTTFKLPHKKFLEKRLESKNPVAVSNYLINQHHFSPEAALQASSTISYLKKLHYLDMGLSFVRERGFSQCHLKKLIRKLPGLLFSDVDKSIKPKLKFFQDLDFSPSDIADIISLKSSGRFLKHDLEKSMVPNIEFLKCCGISSSVILKRLVKFPRFFLLKPERIEDLAKRVDAMGFDSMSKIYLPAMRVLTSMNSENWELKLDAFRCLGGFQRMIS